MKKHKDADFHDLRVVRKRSGPSPAILGKGGPMKDKTKYNRKEKHDGKGID